MGNQALLLAYMYLFQICFVKKTIFYSDTLISMLLSLFSHNAFNLVINSSQTHCICAC